jgi:uncharacterized protein YlzI (FlbEa/FlbD family)
MEFLLNPEFQKNIKTADIKKEWTYALSQVKKDIVHAEIEEINEEIAQLDKKNKRSEAEEKRLDELLNKIIEKQGQIKN